MLNPSNINQDNSSQDDQNPDLINVPTFDKKQNVFTFSVDVLKALKHQMEIMNEQKLKFT
jgi:hypothetical protein